MLFRSPLIFYGYYYYGYVDCSGDCQYDGWTGIPSGDGLGGGYQGDFSCDGVDEAYGVKAGDYIVKINDTQVQGKTLTEAVDLMRGPVGSSIEITVRRVGKKKSLIFNITREIIQIASVKSKTYDKKIGYLRLTSFNENSGSQIKTEIKKFKRDKKINDMLSFESPE